MYVWVVLTAEPCLMQIGDVAEGTIQSIKPYGAFVDLGKGMSGLLHISQISYDRITNVGSILSEGDKLKVCCRDMDSIDPLHMQHASCGESVLCFRKSQSYVHAALAVKAK